MLLHGGGGAAEMAEVLAARAPVQVAVVAPHATDAPPDVDALAASGAPAAANLAVTGIRFTDTDYNALDQIVVGQSFYALVDIAVSDLPANTTYGLTLDLNGDLRRYEIDAGSGFPGGPYTWFYVYWFQLGAPGPIAATATIDDADVVDEPDELDNTVTVYDEAVRLPLPRKLLTPLGGQQGVDWHIVNYVDLDTGPGVRDYRGGPFSYDGHGGIDYTLEHFSLMDAGVPVFAAADGVVRHVADGFFDRKTTFGDQDQTNFVTLDHGDGWLTDYIHLRRDSITVQVGEHVTAGQVIAEVGSSGNSTAAHLHFNLLNGGPVEPFLDPEAFWVEPLAYQGDMNASLDRGTTRTDPRDDLVQAERPPETETFERRADQDVWFWNILSTSGANVIEMPWYRPDGSEYRRWLWDQADPVRGGFWLGVLDLPPDAALGTWSVALVVDGAELSRDTFEVAPAGVPGIRVDQAGGFIVHGRSTPIDFGSVARGASDAPAHRFTITNYGEAPLALGAIGVPDGFAVAAPPPATLEAGQSADFTVVMQPLAVGHRDGWVAVASSDAGTPVYRFRVEGDVTGVGAEVVLFGSAWSAAFAAMFDPGGAGTSGTASSAAAPVAGVRLSEIDVPPAHLPWAGIDRIAVVFTEDVAVMAQDLTLVASSGAPPTVSGFDYDAAAFTAVWSLAAPLGSDALEVRLPGAPGGGGSGSLPEYAFAFDVLVGDADGDGVTSVRDIGALRGAAGSAAGSAGYSIGADLNGDASVDAADAAVLRAHLGDRAVASGPATADALSAAAASDVAVALRRRLAAGAVRQSGAGRRPRGAPSPAATLDGPLRRWSAARAERDAPA